MTLMLRAFASAKLKLDGEIWQNKITCLPFVSLAQNPLKSDLSVLGTSKMKFGFE